MMCEKSTVSSNGRRIDGAVDPDITDDTAAEHALVVARVPRIHFDQQAS